MSTEFPVEWPAGLPVPITAPEYQYAPKSNQTLMDSGRMRNRRTFGDSLQTLAARWHFTADQFDTFKTFFENDLDNGSLIFSLYADSEPSTHAGFLIKTFHKYAFAEAKYTWNRSDNNFEVSALLVFDQLESIEAEDPNYVPPELPELSDILSYSECREEFILSYTNFYGLERHTIYALEIAESADGPWSAHIYFALLTAQESETGEKILTINNDYLGICWFRTAKIYSVANGPTHEVTTKKINPRPSEIAPPLLTMAGGTLLENNSDLGTFDGCLRPLGDYRHGSQGWVIPLSAVEDSLLYSTFTYSRFQKKYAVRFNSSTGFYGTLDGTLSGFNNSLTIVSESGTVTKITTDGSDPTLDTVVPAYDGYTNNVAAYRPGFGGWVKARSFKAGCRSPLVMVSVDKLLPNASRVETEVSGDTVAGNCDLDPAVGSPSSNSCISIYGSVNLAEGFVKNAARNNPNTSFDGSSTPLVRLRSFTTVDHNDGGSFYTNHFMSASAGTLVLATWKRTTNPTKTVWDSIPISHNWGIARINGHTERGRAPLVPFYSLAGSDVSALDSFNESLYQRIGWLLLGSPEAAEIGHEAIEALLKSDEGDGTVSTLLGELDMVVTPMAFEEMREYRWDQIIALGVEAFVSAASEPEPSLTPTFFNYNGDSFELYSDGVVGMLNSGNDWNAAWVITTPTANRGTEIFDFYDAGSITDGDTTYNAGDNWYEAWRFREGPFSAIHGDDFQSYSNGAVVTFDLSQGTGWSSGLSEAWHFGTAFIMGSETWDSYADGAVTGSTTGTNYYPENWRIV